MKMREIDFGAQRPIDGYGPGGFRVAEVWHDGAILVGPAGVAPAPALTADALAPVIDHLGGLVDIVLVGQGPEVAAFPAPLRALFDTAGIGVEAMATPAACRTYNVLLAEERRVAALLLPV